MKNTILTPTPAKLISLFFIIALIIIYSGTDSYYQRKEETRSRYFSELATITENKAKRIESWRRERLGDAWVITSGASFVKSFTDYLNGVNKIENRNLIEEHLELYNKHLLYTDIFILDKNLTLKYSLKKKQLEPEAIENLKKSVSLNEPIISNVFLSKIDSSLFVDIAAPLYLNDELIGGMILRTNPNDYLYPEIQDWPVETKTAETVLLTVEGNEILFLSNLRFQEKSALNLRYKIDDSPNQITSVKAAKGLRGKTEGVDYREKKTLNYIKEIPEQGWIIITKIDQDEVFETLNKNVLNQVFIAAFFLFLFGIGLYWIWSNRKKSLLIQKLEEESTRKAIEKNYEYFVKYANDVIILSDEELNIKDVNERATSLYGYTKDEMLCMNIKDLKTDESHRILDGQKEEEARLKQGVVYETEHKTKSGKRVQLEVSLNKIEVEGKTFFQRIIRDITERKTAEAKLHEEYNLRTAIEESMTSGIAVVDATGRHSVIINGAFANMTGWSKEELIGQTAPFSYWPEEELENIIKMFQLTLQGKTPKEGAELIFKRKSGERFYVNFNASELKNINGETIGWLGVFNDITEKKAAEAKLHEEYNLRTAIEESMSAGISVIDKDGRQIMVNSAFAKMTGWSKQELAGNMPPHLYWPEEELENISRMLQLTVQGKTPKEGFEMIFKRKSGERFPVHFYISELKDKNNKLIGWLAVVDDITEKKAAEAKIFEEHNFRTAIEESMNAGIVTSDLEGRTTYMNSSFTRMVGWSSEELLDKQAPYVYWPEEEYENIYNAFNVVMEGKNPEEGFELIFKRKSGERFYVQFVVTKILNAQGKHIGWLAVVNDISARKIAEEKLRESDRVTRALINATSDSALMIDINGILLVGNDELARKYGNGKTKDELVGTNVFDLAREDIKERRGKYLEEVLKEKKQKRFIETDEKTGIVTDLSIYPVFDNKGNINRLAIFARDITQAQKAEEELRRSEEKYRSIFENIQDVFHQVDNMGIITEISPSVERLLGFKREDIIGKPVMDFYYEPAKMQEFIGTMFKEGKVDDYELVLKDKAGKQVYISVAAHVRMDSQGNFIGTEGVFRNISERKKYEDTLIESERRYRTLVETMHDGIMQVDNEDTIHFVNESTCRMFGYSQKELLGKKSKDMIIHPEDRNIVVIKNQLREKGYSDSYEIRGIKKTGELLWLSISGTPMYDNRGNVIGSVGFIIDITERKQNEAEILKISQAVNQSPIMVIISDRYGNIEYVNPKVTEVTGYRLEELIGKNPRIFKSGYTKEEEYKVLWSTISSGKEWNGELYNKKKNGECYWERTSISCVKDSNGNIIHYIAVKEDITAAKEKELELIKAKEKAEESEKVKSSFLANMSHELRTPMVGILGFSELLKESASNAEQVEFAETINKSGKRLMETLNLILDLSRIESGKLEAVRRNINIVPLINESYTNFIAAARAKNLEMSFTSAADEIIVCVDEKLLFDSLNNLINNAIKYTIKGKIAVEVETGKREGEDIAIIRVKDTGIGIPKGSIDLVFEEFRQASEGYGRVFEGTGLGLTITKNFIEKTGGRIYVESEENKGSVFTVEIPVHCDEKPQVISGKEKKKDSGTGYTPEFDKKHTILCIEDDESTRFFVKQLLKNFFNIAFAENGTAALELVKNRTFDIILMDINLGKGMNGVDVAKEVRSMERYSNVRIIAMTAYAMKGDKERFLKSGMDNYISKPFTKNSLLEVLNEEINIINSRN